MPYRVVQWGTGNVGRLALHGIINHPDLDLVGLVVHSEQKAGRDAGELCGLDPVGVIATNDPAEALALRPDCVSYTATGDLRPYDAIEDMCRALTAGSNVVSSSVVSLIHPATADASMRDPLEAACKAGGTSFFTSGIDPGLANDLMPLTLTGFCERVDTVRVMEILNYATYDQPEVLFETMGFGKPAGHTPLMLMPGVLTLAWGGAVNGIAEGLDVELEEIREVVERWETDTEINLPLGTIPAGGMAGLRFEVQGIVNGRPAIIVEHVTRMHDDAAPDWPQPSGAGSYRISVEGSPSIQCEMEFLGEDGDHNTGGVLATAMRILNAIPAVCDAAPGLLGVNDLPLVTGRHLLS